VRQHLVRREQSAPPLVEKGLRVLETVTDVGGVDYIPRLPPRRRVAPSRIGILFVRSSIHPDSLITRQFLRWLSENGLSFDMCKQVMLKSVTEEGWWP